MPERPIWLDRECDGRWIGEVPAIPGVLVYGFSADAASKAARTLAAAVMEDRRLHGEPAPVAGADGGRCGERAARRWSWRGVLPACSSGYVTGLSGAHTRAESLDELYLNLSEVMGLVTEDGSAPGLLPENEPSTREI